MVSHTLHQVKLNMRWIVPCFNHQMLLYLIGMSPLHVCCWKESLDSLQVLLDAGANINLQSRYGDTPLHLAAQHGHASVVIDNFFRISRICIF